MSVRVVVGVGVGGKARRAYASTLAKSPLDEDDCLLCGGNPLQPVMLGGAYSGSFPTYAISVRIPALTVDLNVVAVGVPSVPVGFDGIACFRFLNRFHYGNFTNPAAFGLES